MPNTATLSRSRSIPFAYVQLSSQYLTFKAPLDAEKALHHVLRKLGTIEESANVSRIDLFVYFVTSGNMEGWDRHAWVTRAAAINTYSVERENKQLKDQLAAEQLVTTELKTKDKKRTIHDVARTAAIKLGVIPEALDDILLYADSVLDLTEDNRVVTRDQVGVTPGVDPEIWLGEMQQKKRYWWPGS